MELLDRICCLQEVLTLRYITVLLLIMISLSSNTTHGSSIPGRAPSSPVTCRPTWPRPDLSDPCPFYWCKNNLTYTLYDPHKEGGCNGGVLLIDGSSFSVTHLQCYVACTPGAPRQPSAAIKIDSTSFRLVVTWSDPPAGQTCNLLGYQVEIATHTGTILQTFVLSKNFTSDRLQSSSNIIYFDSSRDPAVCNSQRPCIRLNTQTLKFLFIADAVLMVKITSLPEADNRLRSESRQSVTATFQGQSCDSSAVNCLLGVKNNYAYQFQGCKTPLSLPQNGLGAKVPLCSCAYRYVFNITGATASNDTFTVGWIWGQLAGPDVRISLEVYLFQNATTKTASQPMWVAPKEQLTLQQVNSSTTTDSFTFKVPFHLRPGMVISSFATRKDIVSRTPANRFDLLITLPDRRQDNSTSLTPADATTLPGVSPTSTTLDSSYTQSPPTEGGLDAQSAAIVAAVAGSILLLLAFVVIGLAVTQRYRQSRKMLISTSEASQGGLIPAE